MHILVVHPVRLIAETIAAALHREQEVERVEFALDPSTASDLVEGHQFDIVLISLGLSGHEALKLTQEIHAEHPQTKILILGLEESEAAILAYIEAGAVGYLSPYDSVDRMLQTVSAAAKDEALLSPQVTALLIERMVELNLGLDDIEVDEELIEELTAREKEVLQYIRQGLSNMEIADRLSIAIGTVKNHVHNVLDKLNVTNRRDAATLLALANSEELHEEVHEIE